jgi:AhpD family alkylhydroperoxidase
LEYLSRAARVRGRWSCQAQPDTVRGYGQLGQANARTGSLGAKTRELIALAVAISLRCDGCIATHTAAARRAGATKEEVAEALAIAISVNAGAALVYSARALMRWIR